MFKKQELIKSSSLQEKIDLLFHKLTDIEKSVIFKLVNTFREVDTNRRRIKMRKEEEKGGKEEEQIVRFANNV